MIVEVTEIGQTADGLSGLGGRGSPAEEKTFDLRRGAVKSGQVAHRSQEPFVAGLRNAPGGYPPHGSAITRRLYGVASLLSPEQRPPAPLLSPRERECLIAAARGETEKDTARQFGISPSTVHAHIESCKRKLGVRNKIEAIINAMRRGEIRAEEL